MKQFLAISFFTLLINLGIHAQVTSSYNHSYILSIQNSSNQDEILEQQAFLKELLNTDNCVYDKSTNNYLIQTNSFIQVSTLKSEIEKKNLVLTKNITYKKNKNILKSTN